MLDLAGIRGTHVPFRGVAAAITDVMAGRVDMVIASLAAGIAQVQAGTLIGLAVSADRTRLPSCRATSPSGGSCSLRLTSAEAAPAVERPSSHAQASMMRRKSATSALLRTSGIQISISLASRLDQNLAERTTLALRPGATNTKGVAL